jgi:predicted adenine nucleotide alpha hydrolase (AANH) superfamily ATPase
MKLLLHTCCGPCYLGVWEDLKNKDVSATAYYYNPNIYPKEEFEKRFENLQIAAKHKSKVIVADYNNESYEAALNTLDPCLVTSNNHSERCLECYRLRLEKTAKYAKENGFDTFSTTLLVSPYQNHDVIKQMGERIARTYSMEFYYMDWRPYFRKGQDEAKVILIYRQKYCGCRFSLAKTVTSI